MCILNGAGAENLLGKGDMLVETAITSSATRYHGAFVDMNHIARVIEQSDSLRDQFNLIANTALETEAIQ
jgi:DNA segregation ATPase FtsK/SpoIIIE-like protein